MDTATSLSCASARVSLACPATVDSRVPLLLPLLDQESLIRSSFSISLTNVNDGLGLSIADHGGLEGFSADATANIEAQPSQVPEPQSLRLLLCGALALLGVWRRIP